jgi:hypothetical protein
MRTTITLNDNLALGLKKLQEKFPNKTFKEIVNETIAKGLAVTETIEKKKFKIKPVNAIPKKGLDFDNIGKLIEYAEGDWHK